MTAIIPQTPPPLPGPAPSPQVTVTVQNPPPALTQLPTGAMIDAKVVASQGKGISELDSVFGKLSIKTSFPLPENVKLDLQILRTVPQLQLMIKAINNTSIQLPSSVENLNEAIKSAALKSPSPLLKNQSVASTTSTPIKMDIGALIKATLLRPIGNPTQPTPSPVAPVPVHSTSAALDPTHGGAAKPSISGALSKALKTAQNIFGGKQNTRQATQQTETKPNLEITQQKPSAPSETQSSTSAASKIAAKLKAGTHIGLKFVGAGTPSTQAAQSSNTTPNVINGIVVATTPSGQPIMNTPLGMMALDTRVPLLPGQSLRLEIIPNQIQIPSGASAESRFENMFLSRDWPNLTDAIREIGLASPAVTQKLINSTLPQPNTQLASNTLFFLNALKGGDMRSWIGTGAATLLDQINPELLGQLDEDFVQLGRAITEPQTNDWRTALVPFFNGMGLEQFQMHTQDQLQESEDGKKEKGSRFIIDVSLSRLGRIQLDGFVRTKGKRLDLIVRTDGPLPKQMRSDINKIYIDFSEAVGVTGQISFQADQKFVEISMPQLSDHENKGIVI